MKIKKGDVVQLASGKDRGKKGKVLEVRPDAGRIVIEGLNLMTKHQRPRKEGEKGQRIQLPASVAVSKVRMVCPKCGKPVRVGYVLSGDQKRRLCRSCKEVIE